MNHLLTCSPSTISEWSQTKNKESKREASIHLNKEAGQPFDRVQLPTNSTSLLEQYR